MQNLYMLDFNLSSARMCLITLDKSYDREGQQRPYYRHRHNAYEIHYVLSGSCTLRVGDGNYILNAGDMCLTAPGLYHSLKNCSEDFDRIGLIFEIITTPKESIDAETVKMLEALKSVSVFCLLAGNMADTLLRIREAAEKCEQKTGGTAKLKTLTELLIIDLAEHIDNHKPETTINLSSIDKRRSFMIDEFFHNNFNVNDGDNKLAETLCVSSRQLDRILKKLYGKGFREKLLEMRLEIAKDFLYTTDKSIVEIADLMGYERPANFSTFIKNKTGKTPTAIRREKVEKEYRLL